MSPCLQNFFARVEAGGPVRIAAIGGSITTGHAAYPPEEEGWFGQLVRAISRHWPQAQIERINLGISGTDSALGAHRVQAQIVETQADLVIVEFGVNDQWLDPAVRGLSYEGLLRQILRAPNAPSVLCLHLVQQHDRERDAVEVQLKLTRHYGLLSLDFGRWLNARPPGSAYRWQNIFDAEDPIHPNALGHRAIAEALSELLCVAPSGKPETARAALPPALYGDDFEFTADFGNEDIAPYLNRGFLAGGDAHTDWERRPGGDKRGWYCTEPGATLSFMVSGRQIGLFCPESDQYSDLEAWVDEGQPVRIREHQTSRQNYLGWAYTAIGRDLPPGRHLLHVRALEQTPGTPSFHAGIVALLCAGLQAPAQPDFELDTQAPSSGQWIAADSPDFRYVGRFDDENPQAPLMAWSGCEIRFRFTGSCFSLRLESLPNASHLALIIDGQPLRLDLREGGPHDYRLARALPPGEHEVSIIKATEAYFASVCFHGLLIENEARMLPPPPARRLSFEFYGDSITAGACNADPAEDQYEDLSTHDGSRAYGALLARRLGADYLGVAVSGAGLTCSWNEYRLPEVFERTSLHGPARNAAPGRSPDLVFINLGQNDHGLAQALNQAFPSDFGPRYVDFVRRLRARYPESTLVCLLGGMGAWQECPELCTAFEAALAQLRREDDKIHGLRLEARSACHPRLDVHDLMARELESFLHKNIPLENV